MNLNKFLFTFMIAAGSHCVSAQSVSEFFPTGLTYRPHYGNLLEPRAGSTFVLGENRLRLDIGTSSDIYRKSFDDGRVFSAGADFFTWTRLRKNNDFKFPVVAVDYLFGVNAAYMFTLADKDAGVRFRFSHISAHLVDGQYSNETDLWRDSLKPFVYSREFIEFFPSLNVTPDTRIYTGITYIFHTIPEAVKPFILQAGAEKYFSEMTVIGSTPFLLYDLKLSGNDVYRSTHTVTAGFRFGKLASHGFSIVYTYTAGNSVHGMFYNNFEKYSSVGFNADF